MIEIKGKYNTAICYCSTLEETAREQIKSVCDQQAFENEKIRIMPDVHAGKGCTIGTTMTLTDKVVPGMVGVDIGCGMEVVRIEEKEIDFDALDKTIRANIPAGREVRETLHSLNKEIELSDLRCAGRVNLERARLSIGSLGGGNHFIEADKDEEGNLYLVVHSGSRHLGCEVADFYHEEGFKALCGTTKGQMKELIEKLKSEGREREIQAAVEKLKDGGRNGTGLPKDLAYVEGEMFEDYIHDMKIVQRFAMLNRKAMTDVILSETGLTAAEQFTTIHNYIDTDAMILRKGSVSAKKGETLLIPVNMRDGSLLCTGKGNAEWNYSAPHGAGRLMSRNEAVKRLSLRDYEAEMRGIYTTCVSERTLDESPMAYKSMEEIVSQISPTVKIVDVIKPVYNFKAAE